MEAIPWVKYHHHYYLVQVYFVFQFNFHKNQTMVINKITFNQYLINIQYQLIYQTFIEMKKIIEKRNKRYNEILSYQKNSIDIFCFYYYFQSMMLIN